MSNISLTGRPTTSSSPDIEFVQGNDGVNVPPDSTTHVLILLGDNTQGIATSGNAGTNTETITALNSSTSQKGVVLLASNAETIAGSVTTKATTPDDIKAKLGAQTAHGLGYGAGQTSAIAWLGEATNGQLPIGKTGNAPVLANITSTDGSVTVTNGPGTIDLAVNTSNLITNYNTPGTYTWTMNAKTKYVKVYAWNSGGGGGSGRQGLTTAAGGGGGGSGGGGFVYEGPATFFPSSATVVVAAGGAGGLAQGSTSTNGNPGSPGIASSFGNINSPVGANSFGVGGTTTSAAGSAVAAQKFYTPYTTASIANLAGGAGGNTTGSPATVTILPTNSFVGTGGGGGSGADAVTPRQAGTGGRLEGIDLSTIINGAAGGIETGTIDGSPGTDFSSSTLTGYVGGGTGGGGGGGQSIGIVAGNGGQGGFPGGGGGGGGGSINGTNSGHGGTGGNGQVLIIESF